MHLFASQRDWKVSLLLSHLLDTCPDTAAQELLKLQPCVPILSFQIQRFMISTSLFAPLGLDGLL